MKTGLLKQAFMLFLHLCYSVKNFIFLQITATEQELESDEEGLDGADSLDGGADSLDGGADNLDGGADGLDGLEESNTDDDIIPSKGGHSEVQFIQSLV